MTTITTTTTPSIFISYRRDDSAGHAGRLADRLVQHVGPDRVFRDIEDIAAGEDFVACLERKLDECQVLLALIGPRWLATGASGQPRICEEHDWVRREIARALDRGDGLRVIPLLLQGANMPAADVLPPDLQRLTRLNALELRETQFERDLAYLVDQLMPPDRGARLRKLALAASLSVLVAGGAYGAYWKWDRTPERAEHHLSERGLTLDADTFVDQAAQGNAETVGLFIRAGQDVEAENEDGRTALEHAATNEDLDMVRLLLDADASPDRALPIAAAKPDDEMFELLMSQAPGAEAIDDAMRAAAGLGDIARMERLLAVGAKVDPDNRGPMRNATFNTRPAALRWLIAKGARVGGSLDESGWTLLHMASGASMPVDAVGNPVLETVTVLLDAGADPNGVRTASGGLLSTPLLMAARREQTDIARLLLDRKAQPDVASTEGSASTPLMIAAGEDNAEMVKLLLERGATIDAADASGATALMRVAGLRRLAMVDLLIEHGADVNHQNNAGLSALMLAARNLDPHVAARLLEAHADVAARSTSGDTAMAWLESVTVYPGTREERDADDVEKLLVAHGAAADASGRTLARRSEAAVPPTTDEASVELETDAAEDVR